MTKSNQDLKSKILFGTDYYMVQIVTSKTEFNHTLRQGIGDDNYRQIAETNPQVFLASH